MSDQRVLTNSELDIMVKKLSGRLDASDKRQKELEEENQFYKDQLKGMGKDTAFDRFKKKAHYKAPVREDSILVKEPMLNQRGDNYYPTADAQCPYCIEKGKDNFLDQQDSGRWACRQCGKMWFTEQLGKKYSKEMELASGKLEGVYSDVGSRE